MLFPKLTKRDAQGVPRFYWGEVTGGKYRTHSQRTTTGPVQTSAWVTPREQDLRTASQQAAFEVEAIYRKRERLGWLVASNRKDRQPRPDTRYFAPMLAQKYPTRQPKFPCALQPKLDGVRCIGQPDALWTRKNTGVTSVPHIKHEVMELLSKHRDILALDGELYLHGWPLPKINGLARRHKPDAESCQLEYHVFDCELKYAAAFESRQRRLSELRDLPACIKIVRTDRCEDVDDLDFLHHRYVRLGYEGTMIRDLDAIYQHKRTTALLKRKDFHEEEATITGIEDGNGGWRKIVKKVHLVDDDGVTFRAGLS